jgi:hypothetical protein
MPTFFKISDKIPLLAAGAVVLIIKRQSQRKNHYFQRNVQSGNPDADSS